MEREGQDRDLVTLGDLISSAGYEPRSVLDEIRGRSFNFKNKKVLVFGSLCTENPHVNAFLERERENLQKFVRRGGCVIMFAQNGENRESEDWLIPAMLILRAGGHAESLEYVAAEHPLFSSPNRITAKRLNDNWKAGHLSAEPFRLVSRGSVLAAKDKKGRSPWCVEFGWGRGRVIFFACKPELPRRLIMETKRVTRDLVENALSYAFAVARGRPSPLPDQAIVVETTTGYRPATWSDSKKADFTFETEVNAAVDRGAAYLKSMQYQDGSWRYGPSHSAGATALVLVALLGTGINKHKPFIGEGIDFLLQSRIVDDPNEANTYDVSLTLMVLDAWGAPLYERFELEKLPPEKRERFKFQRNLSEEERVLMTRCCSWLVSAQSRTGYWSYGLEGNGRYGDLSNTQFAILGLKAASRCGIDVPRKTWADAIEALLASQASTGVDLSLPEITSPGARGGKPRFYVSKACARPWGYVCRQGRPGGPGMGGPPGQSYSGSRTAMGVSSLLIAHEGLALDSRSAGNRYSSDVRRAVRDGFGWLFRHWSVTENPGLGAEHHYYYLYAVERVGVLSSRQFIGDRDWYREGAAFLLRNQHASGAWNNQVIDTSFALMFLKRSTPPPVITTKR